MTFCCGTLTNRLAAGVGILGKNSVTELFFPGRKPEGGGGKGMQSSTGLYHHHVQAGADEDAQAGQGDVLGRLLRRGGRDVCFLIPIIDAIQHNLMGGLPLSDAVAGVLEDSVLEVSHVL